MKSFIYGIAILLLCSIFLVFQQDINQMQRESDFIYQTANEIANAAALQIVYESVDDSDIYTYSDGYIQFVEDEACRKGFEVARKNLSLNSAYESAKNYYADGFNIAIYLFNENGTVYKAVNGGSPSLIPKVFTRGCLATEFISEIDSDSTVKIGYPCVMCVVDAGKPRIRLADIENNARIRKLGIYEYKDAYM